MYTLKQRRLGQAGTAGQTTGLLFSASPLKNLAKTITEVQSPDRLYYKVSEILNAQFKLGGDPLKKLYKTPDSNLVEELVQIFNYYGISPYTISIKDLKGNFYLTYDIGRAIGIYPDVMQSGALISGNELMLQLDQKGIKPEPIFETVAGMILKALGLPLPTPAVVTVDSTVTPTLSVAASQTQTIATGAGSSGLNVAPAVGSAQDSALPSPTVTAGIITGTPTATVQTSAAGIDAFTTGITFGGIDLSWILIGGALAAVLMFGRIGKD